MAFTFKHGDRPLEGYEIQRGVGRGGFGEVYYAISDGGREVALKYVHSNAQMELRGARQCMNLKSPYLVDTFDVVHNDAGEPFVIMEYIHGPSLRDLLAANPHGLGIEQATFILDGLIKGLAQLHEHGIVHRDLKPANIFYEEGYVKIADYGLSKFMAQSASGANTMSVGTVAYMAPEVGSGNYSRTIDIYALGVILYELLVGRVPFEGQSTGEVLMKHLVEQPEVTALPEPFAAVIRKALAKDPAERYQAVGDLASDALGAAQVRNSLAGFDATQLTRLAESAARQIRKTAEASVVPSEIDQPITAAQASQGSQDVRFAGFWVRLMAMIIDWCIISIPAALLYSVFPISWLIYIAYSVVMMSWLEGQTIGKRVCGIRVVTDRGVPVGLTDILTREASKFLSVLTMMFGFAMAGITRRKRALHDLIASTYVVHVRPDETLSVAFPKAPVSPVFEVRGGVVAAGIWVHDAEVPVSQRVVQD